MTQKQESGLQLAIVVVIIAVLIAMGFGWRNCHRRGGTYVRGIVWMECIR